LAEKSEKSPVVLKGDLSRPPGNALWLIKWLLLVPHFVILVFLWLSGTGNRSVSSLFPEDRGLPGKAHTVARALQVVPGHSSLRYTGFPGGRRSVLG